MKILPCALLPLICLDRGISLPRRPVARLLAKNENEGSGCDYASSVPGMCLMIFIAQPSSTTCLVFLPLLYHLQLIILIH
jgi:hypothetical protein